MPIPTKNPKISDPKLPKDQLGSIQRQLSVHVLCEGEIEGFPSATGNKGSAEYNRTLEKDIFLNGTQILQQSSNSSAPDSKKNFQDVKTEVRFGTSSQTRIKGFKDTETEFTVGNKLFQGVSINKTINNRVDRLRVTLQVDALQRFKDNGDVVGTEVRHKIKIIQANGTTRTPIDNKIKGKTPNAYTRDYIINIPDSYVYPLQLEVTRITSDSTSPKKQNSSRWLQYTEIQDKADRFPNTAHVALRVDAEQFPQTPNVMFRIRGRKIKIPHNASVRSDGSLSFSGVFNGSLNSTRVYCNDPAWVL